MLAPVVLCQDARYRAASVLATNADTPTTRLCDFRPLHGPCTDPALFVLAVYVCIITANRLHPKRP
jgi:hypothetical protein